MRSTWYIESKQMYVCGYSRFARESAMEAETRLPPHKQHFTAHAVDTGRSAAIHCGKLGLAARDSVGCSMIYPLFDRFVVMPTTLVIPHTQVRDMSCSVDVQRSVRSMEASSCKQGHTV